MKWIMNSSLNNLRDYPLADGGRNALDVRRKRGGRRSEFGSFARCATSSLHSAKKTARENRIH